MDAADVPLPVPVPPPGHADARAASPPRRRRIVLAVVGVVALAGAGVAIPNLARSRLNANESMAIAMLKNISSAQAQLQACGVVDVNGNDSGEYGYFAELAGTAPLRAAAGATPKKCEPPVLGPRFGTVVGGRVHTGGYVFQMFLKGKDGRWLAEAAAGGAQGVPVDAATAELEWLCYAWPEDFGWSGKRSFLISQSGDVLATNGSVEVYDGETGPMPGQSGFSALDGVWQLAANRVDARGNTWVVV